MDSVAADRVVERRSQLDALVVGTVANLLWSLSRRPRQDVLVRPSTRAACTQAIFGTGAAHSDRSPRARARPTRRRSPPRARIIDNGKRRPRHADRPFSPRSRASWAAAELAARAAARAPLSAAKPRRRDARRASRKRYVSAPPCRARWSSPRRPSVRAGVARPRWRLGAPPNASRSALRPCTEWSPARACWHFFVVVAAAVTCWCWCFSSRTKRFAVFIHAPLTTTAG